jgi:hypothetical protein
VESKIRVLPAQATGRIPGFLRRTFEMTELEILKSSAILPTVYSLTCVSGMAVTPDGLAGGYIAASTYRRART